MKKLVILGVFFALLLVSTPAFAKKSEVNRCRVPDDYATIQEAVDEDACDEIIVGPGEWSGATVDRTVVIKGTGGAVINDGPNSHSFLRAGFLFADDYSGNNTTISGFTFEGSPQPDRTDDGKLDFPVFSRGANNITVEHNVLKNSLQGISNWGGSNWHIHHNEIEGLWTLNGGGIGIICADRSGGVIQNNEISHNKISGVLYVNPNDGGGYNGSGIVLYADFRYGQDGAEEISGNKVVHNKVSLVSDNPEVVDVVAFEMTDSRDDPDELVIFDNAVGFNDFRGTELQIDLTPDNLDEYNYISRNLGDNRSHGLHPSVFGPGGV